MFTQLMKQQVSAKKPAPVQRRSTQQRPPYYAFDLSDAQNTAVTSAQEGLCVQELLRHFPVRTESMTKSGEQVIQARIIIEGRAPMTPYSKNVKDFFDAVIVPWLNEQGYKSYGIMKQLRDFITQDQYFANDAAFLEQFSQYLQTQTRRVRGGGERPVIQPLSIGGLSRPAWPRQLKEQLQAKAKVQEGGNIRHVVRNNTLKRALEIFYQRNGAEAMFELARQLGMIGEHVLALDACVRMLYKRLYLNIDNLWMGDALVNQMIGFLATPLSEYGIDICVGAAVFNVDELYRILVSSTQLVRGRKERKDQIINDIANMIVAYACELGNAGLSRDDFNQQIGLFVDDVGLNLGFDLIDDMSDNILERQSRLIEAEKRLQKYIITMGEADDLLGIFNIFLNINTELESDSDMEEDMGAEEEVCEQEAYTEVIYDTSEFELTRQNNCLIYAIAGALNVQVEDAQITNIRIFLNDVGYADIGDMLDVTDDNVRNTILLLLNLDYRNYTFRIYNQRINQIHVFPPGGGGGQYIDLVFTGNHFLY